MPSPKTGNYRWVVVALLFFATTINYLDRQVLSYLKPTLEKEFGWDNTTYGYINLLRDPPKKKNLDPAELALINEDAVTGTAADVKIGWGALFRIRQTWAFITGKFLTDPIWYFFLTWLPDYFSKTFHLDLKKPALPLIIIYTATTVGNIGGGYLSSTS